MSFLGYIEKLNILVKTAVEIVWASFGKNWAIFILTSGHTGNDSNREKEEQTKVIGKEEEKKGWTWWWSWLRGKRV